MKAVIKSNKKKKKHLICINVALRESHQTRDGQTKQATQPHFLYTQNYSLHRPQRKGTTTEASPCRHRLGAGSLCRQCASLFHAVNSDLAAVLLPFRVVAVYTLLVKKEQWEATLHKKKHIYTHRQAYTYPEHIHTHEHTPCSYMHTYTTHTNRTHTLKHANTNRCINTHIYQE